MENSQTVQNYINKKGTYYVFRTLLYPVALSFRPTIYGKENIPEEGGVIIASNHRNRADPGFACMSTRRVVHFLAKKELHDSKFAWFFRMAGTIPVDRGVHGTGVMEIAEEMLRRGEVIGIYPEGTRNKTDDPIQPLKYGAVRLAQKTGAPIVPLAISGIGKPFKSQVKVCFGKPYHVAQDADLDKENEKLRKKLTELYLNGKEEE